MPRFSRRISLGSTEEVDKSINVAEQSKCQLTIVSAGPVQEMKTPESWLALPGVLPFTVPTDILRVPMFASSCAKSVCSEPVVVILPAIFLDTKVQTLKEVSPKAPAEAERWSVCIDKTLRTNRHIIPGNKSKAEFCTSIPLVVAEPATDP